MSHRPRQTMSFTDRVRRVVAAIPRGQVLTYQQVARRAGSPRAYRAVGTIMKHNFDPAIPCHRVIKSNGEVGEYNRGQKNKIAKLKSEGYVLFPRGSLRAP